MNGNIHRSKLQPVTDFNEVSADSTLALAHRRRSPRAPFLDSRKSGDLRSKTTNALEDAPSEIPRLNIKPADEESVGPQVTSELPTKLCVGEALCRSRKKNVCGTRPKPPQSDHSALYKQVVCGTK